MIVFLLDFAFHKLINFLIVSIFILILSLIIDLIIGEVPTRIHPVVFIGKLIDLFTNLFIGLKNRISGVLLSFSVLVVLLILIAIILLISSVNIYLEIIIASILVSTSFSIKLLISSAKNIKNKLVADINLARKDLQYLVSRNTKELSKKQIISAAIETLSENITDSVVSVFFYYLLTLLVIVVLIKLNLIAINLQMIIIVPILVVFTFRAINTLDAMVGYKNKKYCLIGYFPAKVDDLLNFIPARFSALVIVIASFFIGFNWKNAYRILKRDSKNGESPNSGFTIAATAGALDIELEKEGYYRIGEEINKLSIDDIDKAIKLSKLSIFISFLVLVLLFSFIVFLLI